MLPMTPSYKTMVVFGRVFEYLAEFPERRVFKLLEKIDFESDAATGCWRWIGTKDDKGYGYIHLGDGGRWSAHRAAWFMFKGPLSGDLHLHHQTEAPINCIGPNCCNPDHLLPLSPRDHAKEYTPTNITAIQAAMTECQKGHDLTVEENVYRMPSGVRRCRICLREWNRRQYHLRKGSTEFKVPERTHCKRGHLLDEANTYEYAGAKMCRKCHADLTLRRYHEKRAVSGPKTHCIHGHARAELGIARKDGGWSCKACMAANGAKRWEEARAERTVDGIVNCPQGHPLTPENIYRYTFRGKPMEICATCRSLNGRRAYEKRLAKYGKVPSRPSSVGQFGKSTNFQSVPSVA